MGICIQRRAQTSSELPVFPTLPELLPNRPPPAVQPSLPLAAAAEGELAEFGGAVAAVTEAGNSVHLGSSSGEEVSADDHVNFAGPALMAPRVGLCHALW